MPLRDRETFTNQMAAAARPGPAVARAWRGPHCGAASRREGEVRRSCREGRPAGETEAGHRAGREGWRRKCRLNYYQIKQINGGYAGDLLRQRAGRDG